MKSSPILNVMQNVIMNIVDGMQNIVIQQRQQQRRSLHQDQHGQ